jgi:hypothetical protein
MRRAALTARTAHAARAGLTSRGGKIAGKAFTATTGAPPPRTPRPPSP